MSAVALFASRVSLIRVLPKSNAQAFIGLFFVVSMHFSCCVFVMLPNLTFITVALIFIYRIIWPIVKKGHKAVVAGFWLLAAGH